MIYNHKSGRVTALIDRNMDAASMGSRSLRLEGEKAPGNPIMTRVGRFCFWTGSTDSFAREQRSVTTEFHEIFPWNANFETGIPAIDVQHKRLVELINTLAMHLAYRSGELALGEVFREIDAYIDHHFATEEKLIHRYLAGDPLLEEHEKTHRDFTKDMARLRRERADKPEDALCEEILAYLSHWLALHILDADKRIAKVVLAIQAGAGLDEAKAKAGEEMAGLMKVLIETILSMYDTLSARTLELMREVHERKRIEEKLRLAASVYENTLEAVFIADARATIIDVNDAFIQFTGYARQDIIGKSLKVLKNALQDEQARHIWHAVADKGHWRGEIRSRNRDGEISPEWLSISAIRNHDGDTINYVGLLTSITQLVQRQHQLDFHAQHDVLTRLPNRLLFTDRLQQAIAKARRGDRHCAVCYIDLDEFKAVNDTHGHAAGDKLLQQIAMRIRHSLRANDTFARLGGDEFERLMEDIASPQDSHAFLERVMKEIERPFDIDGQQIHISASIGVDTFSAEAKDATVLLEQADQAMYRVKKTGKSNYAFFATTD